MEILQNINIALRFLLELCALAALGYWGFHTGSGMATKIVLGIGAPLVAALMWITFGAPGAAMLVPDPWHLGLEIVIFGGATVALAATGRLPLAWVFALTFAINRVLMYIWGQ